MPDRFAAGLRRCTELVATGPSRLHWTVRYGGALILTAVATGVRLAIAPQESGLPYVTYFPAATLSAVVGGLDAGLLATLVGAALAVALFIPPFGEFKVTLEAFASSAVFLADEVLVCLAIELMRRYYKGYTRSLAELETAHAAERAARLEAERANQAKSRFLAAASHDLRQPYQAMRLLLAALQSNALSPEKRAQALQNMDTAMRAGEELLRSLLDVSTLEAGVVTLKPEQVVVREMVEAVAARHHPVAAAKGLRLRARACSGALFCDPVLLRRMLDNLVTNAIRYTDRGGILVGCRRAGGRAVFDVWDTGIGIADDQCEAIFEEFYQVDNPARDRVKGFGLGLAVVRKTALLLGGSVSVRSRLGQGTRFRISLPNAGTPSRQDGVPPVPGKTPDKCHENLT